MLRYRYNHYSVPRFGRSCFVLELHSVCNLNYNNASCQLIRFDISSFLLLCVALPYGLKNLRNPLTTPPALWTCNFLMVLGILPIQIGILSLGPNSLSEQSSEYCSSLVNIRWAPCLSGILSQLNVSRLDLPDACNSDVSQLLCKSSRSATCLSPYRISPWPSRSGSCMHSNPKCTWYSRHLLRRNNMFNPCAQPGAYVAPQQRGNLLHHCTVILSVAGFVLLTLLSWRPRYTNTHAGRLCHQAETSLIPSSLLDSTSTT